MKILFLTYDFPFPFNSGGKIRAYHLIKNLARCHQITLFSYYRQEKPQKYLPELSKYCPRIFLFKRRPAWSWQNLARSLLTPLPFAAATYYSFFLKEALKKELSSNHYDFVHFESFYPALYLPLVKKLGVKTLLGNENIESRLYGRYADSRGFWLRWLLKLEVWRLRLFEENLWRQADINIAVSPSDALAVEKVTKKNCPVIANGVDLTCFAKINPARTGQKIIFIGSLSYQANRDAVKYFLEKIYPEIKKKIAAIKFILVSGHQPSWLEKFLADPSIKFIKDRETPSFRLLPQASVFIAPLRVASGTNIKILEALAAGLPVVTTTIGAEGLAVEDGREVIIADKPGQFALAVVGLLTDSNRRQRMSFAGRALVRRQYRWSEIAKQLEEVYREKQN